jgi:DNA-binding NarL/FixJ family response regulator
MEIVGREKELADIESALRGLSAGVGDFRAYVADPGMGKTAMLLAMSEALREAGVPALRGRCGRLEDLIDFALTSRKRGEPAAVLFDDLHGLGSDAVEAADRLLEMTTGPLLFAVAYRPRQLPLWLTAILYRTQAYLGARHLAPLTLEETGRLIGPRPDLEAIHRDSEGIPLYAGVLADAAHPGAAQLFAELAALPPDDLATAQAAAVLDGPFLPETLLAVCELDPQTTQWSLDRLAAADIIRAPRSGPLLAWRHKTLATIAYRTTTISQRHRLHLRADRELERSGAPAIVRAAHVANSFDPEHPDRHRTLALGAQQALTSDPAAATTWLEAVDARLTRDHPDWSQTQLLLAKARLHMGRLDDSRTTFLKLGNGSAPEEADAALHTGRIERLLGRYPEASALIRTGMTAAGSVAARGVGLSELSAIAADCSRYGEADRLATEAIQIARSAGDRLQECAALAAAAWARSAAGDVASGGGAASAAARLMDAMIDGVAVHDIDCLRLLGQSELLLGRLADAQRHIVRGVRLARRTGQRHVLPNLLKVQAELELRLGRLDRASEVLDEAEPLAAESGAIAIHTLLTSIRASTLMWQNPSARAGEAVAAAERAAGYAANANTSLAWPLQAQLALGETLIFAGQPGHGGRVLLTAGGGAALPRVSDLRRVRWWEILAISAVADRDLGRADEYATLAVEAVDRAPTDFRRGYAYRARALVESAKGATAAALEAGEIAAAAFTAAAASLDVGRTQVVLASIAIDAGLLDDAGELLAMAGALARRCRSERLGEQVDAQLARLPQQTPQRDWQATLTRRERDIALLAGQALASTAIAAQLHLSVRTVDSHLGRIYRKLGVTNRVALANLLSRP